MASLSFVPIGLRQNVTSFVRSFFSCCAGKTTKTVALPNDDIRQIVIFATGCHVPSIYGPFFWLFVYCYRCTVVIPLVVCERNGNGLPGYLIYVYMLNYCVLLYLNLYSNFSSEGAGYACGLLPQNIRYHSTYQHFIGLYACPPPAKYGLSLGISTFCPPPSRNY